MAAERSAFPAAAGAPAVAGKIPVLTAWFWLIKVMITGTDVYWPDYVYARLGQLVTSGAICVALIVALAAQFRTRCYRAWAFWPAVIAVSLAGTEAANGLHVKLGLPYLAVALAYLILLVALLAWWRAREGTLSLRSIDTASRESFFWAAALAACALGTAIAHLGGGGVPAGLPRVWLWAALTGCIAAAWWRFGLSPVLAFWSCFALTRPLGTSIATWLAAGQSADGLGLGQWPVTAGLAAGVLIAVAYLAIGGRDVPRVASDSTRAPQVRRNAPGP